jgi:thiamine-phosphate pyrophosphorylase
MSIDRPRLFLTLPPSPDAGFAALLRPALEAADVACVLGRFARGAEATARELAQMVQAKGAAFLVAEDMELMAACGADGVHVAGAGAAVAAARRLKPAHIVGAGGLPDRDAAMTAGEADIDYVMFGGLETGLDAAGLLARVAWWAEIFTVPCVAQAESLADVAPLAQAGADFVALAEAVWTDPRGPAAALAAAQAALALAETAA